jgi:hypothetical protein
MPVDGDDERILVSRVANLSGGLADSFTGDEPESPGAGILRQTCDMSCDKRSFSGNIRYSRCLQRSGRYDRHPHLAVYFEKWPDGVTGRIKRRWASPPLRLSLDGGQSSTFGITARSSRRSSTSAPSLEIPTATVSARRTQSCVTALWSNRSTTRARTGSQRTEMSRSRE